VRWSLKDLLHDCKQSIAASCGDDAYLKNWLWLLDNPSLPSRVLWQEYDQLLQQIIGLLLRWCAWSEAGPPAAAVLKRAIEMHLFEVGPWSRLDIRFSQINNTLADTRVAYAACNDHIKLHRRSQDSFKPRVPVPAGSYRYILNGHRVCRSASWLEQADTTSMAGTKEFSPQADYMDGLPAAFADMSDAILLVDDARLPVHKAILAANSAVFAELFMTASAQQSLSLLEVPLPGNRMWDVYTALKYLYRGCTPCASSSPEIKSTDDAKALVLFAHQCAIKSLLNACEEFLVKLAQGDLSDGGLPGYYLFTNFDAIASWTKLADVRHLDTLLAHCEVAMINYADMHLWCDPAITSIKISRGSLVRMLRASQLFIYRSKGDQAKYKGSQRERILSEVKPRTVTQCSSTAAPDHHAAIAILMQWKREML